MPCQDKYSIRASGTAVARPGTMSRQAKALVSSPRPRPRASTTNVGIGSKHLRRSSLPVSVRVSGRRLSMDPAILNKPAPDAGAAGDAARPGSGGDRPRSAGDRKPSITGDVEEDMEMFEAIKAEALLPLKEDLSDWLNKTIVSSNTEALSTESLLPIKEDLCVWLSSCIGTDITPESFLSVLDNGVDICRLAKLIQEKALEAYNNGAVPEAPPKAKIKFRENAKSETWFARDNTANFLTWARDYGVKQECMFETEGLVMHREERSVVLCLLELARLGMKYGIEPPNLIKLEKEIENEETQSNDSGVGMGSDKDSVSAASKGKKGAGAGKTPRKRIPSAKSNDELDKHVRQIFTGAKCNCPNCYQVSRISEGRYKIGDKNVFVRLLKGKHVMVRVGGGWDTLQHYIATHDPCKIMEFKRHGSSNNVSDGDKFLYIRGKYKS